MISLPVTTDENNGVGWPTTCCAVGLLPLSCSGEQSKNVEMDDCAPRSNGLKRRGDDPRVFLLRSVEELEAQITGIIVQCLSVRIDPLL